MDSRLPRWIWASASKHFDNNKQSYPLFVEGYDRINHPQDSLEFRLDGPDFTEPSKGYLIIDIAINILVTSIKDETDAHKFQRIIGVAAAAFTNNINVFQYGDNNTTLVGCFNLQRNILVTQFGQVEGMQNILMATVEGQYRMVLY